MEVLENKHHILMMIICLFIGLLIHCIRWTFVQTNLHIRKWEGTCIGICQQTHLLYAQLICFLLVDKHAKPGVSSLDVSPESTIDAP